MNTNPRAEFFGIRAKLWGFIFALALLAWAFLFFDRVEEQSGRALPAPAITTGSAQKDESLPPRRRYAGEESTHPDAHLASPDPRRIAEFINILSAPGVEDRRQAAAALSRLGLAAKAALPKLKELEENDPDETVRSRAREALYNIRGFDPGIETPLAK